MKCICPLSCTAVTGRSPTENIHAAAGFTLQKRMPSSCGNIDVLFGYLEGVDPAIDLRHTACSDTYAEYNNNGEVIRLPQSDSAYAAFTAIGFIVRGPKQHFGSAAISIF